MDLGEGELTTYVSLCIMSISEPSVADPHRENMAIVRGCLVQPRAGMFLIGYQSAREVVSLFNTQCGMI